MGTGRLTCIRDFLVLPERQIHYDSARAMFRSGYPVLLSGLILYRIANHVILIVYITCLRDGRRMQSFNLERLRIRIVPTTKATWTAIGAFSFISFTASSAVAQRELCEGEKKMLKGN